MAIIVLWNKIYISSCSNIFISMRGVLYTIHLHLKWFVFNKYVYKLFMLTKCSNNVKTVSYDIY